MSHLANIYADELNRTIAGWLRLHACGRRNARPRRELLAFLARQGWDITDRTLRKRYARMPFVGYVTDRRPGQPHGLFWIATTREALDMEETRRRLGKASLSHAKKTAVAHAYVNQLEVRT